MPYAAATLRPIGQLRTPFATLADCPSNGRRIQPPPDCTAEIDPEFHEGLADLALFSHLILLYWLGPQPGLLTITPKRDGRPHGVFATRTPVRPNPIGLSVVTLHGIEAGRLTVRNLDCRDGTPLLDVKPYLRTTGLRARRLHGLARRVTLATLSAEALLDLYRRRAASPVEALQAVTERIARLNPGINAFALLDPRAVAAAHESEQRWRAGRPQGALDGVPCTVKDLVDLAGHPTRRGSRTTSPDPVSDDAPLVTGLKTAGAVIIGKTTTTEFGWKTPGDCPLHGITRNPRDPARSTGGSSSGAGAAAAAGFGPLHVGTDAGGSVRIPAAWCGVVGLKPSFGRVPQWPLGAFATVAVAGPMTRTVRDAALMLGAMAQPDWRDPFCLPAQPAGWLDTIEHGVEGLRVAVLRNPGFDAPVDAENVAAVEQAAQILHDAGATLEEIDPGLPDTGHLFATLWSTALRLVVANTEADRRHLLDPALVALAEAPDPPGTTLMQAAAQQVLAAHAMARLHRAHDLVLCPTVPGPPPLADAPTVDPVRCLLTQWAPWTFAFNLTRQPAITVPLAPGRNVQLAAAVYRDDLVLRAARVLELACPPLPPAGG